MRNRVVAPLEKTYFFLGIVIKNEHDDAYLCSLIRLHSLANNVFTSLRLANLTGTADGRFIIFFFHPANCRTAFFPDILPLGKISSGRDTAKSVILNNNRPPLTQPPSQSYSVPEPAGQGEKSSFSYRRQVGIHSGALQSKIQPKTKNRYSNGSKRKTSDDSA